MQQLFVLEKVLKQINEEVGKKRYSVGILKEDEELKFVLKDSDGVQSGFGINPDFISRISSELDNDEEKVILKIKKVLTEIFAKADKKEPVLSVNNLKNVFPRLKRSSFVETDYSKGKSSDSITYFESPFFGTVITLVVDLGESYFYVTENGLKNFGMDKEQLLAIALKNLKDHDKLKGWHLREVELSKGKVIHIPSWVDELNAARLLLLDIPKMVTEKGSTLYVSIPAEDKFLIVEEDKFRLDIMEKMTIATLYESESPISPAIHKFSQGGKMEVMMPKLHSN